MATTTGTLCDELWASIEGIHRKVLAHPFVTGLTDGTLDEAAFRFYIVQDTLYLREYARVYCIAAGKASSDDDMLLMNNVATDLVRAEQTVHNEFFEAWGLSHDDVWSTPLAPTNLAYATYMLNVAQQGTFAESVAAVLPCAWIYMEVGKELARSGSPHALFQKWIDTYAGDEYEQEVRVLIDLMNRLAPTIGPLERRRIDEHFLIGARYEWMFWDMGYRQEGWPV